MDSIIRGTNAAIQIKEDLDFATITTLELHLSADIPDSKTLEGLTLDADTHTIYLVN